MKAYLHRPQGPPPFPSEINAKDGTPPRHDAAGLQGDVCFSPDGRYVVGASNQAGLLIWDTQAPTGRDGAMAPLTDLPGPKTSTLVGYNPRHNLLASAASEVVLWLPDPDLL